MLELIVVLAIVGAALVLMVPRLQGTLAKQGLQLTAERLAATLRAAHAESVQRSRDTVVVLDLASRSFWAEAHPVAVRFDSAIGIEVLEDGLEWAGRARRVRFRADGSATGGIIRLTQGRAQALVGVDWLTGAVTLTREAAP